MFGKSRQELDNERISYIIQLKFKKFKTKLVSKNCSKEIKMTKFASKTKNSCEINHRRAHKEDPSSVKTLCDCKLVKLRHYKRRIHSELNLGKPKWQIGKQGIELFGIAFSIFKAKNC